MNTTQHLFYLSPGTKLRLSEIEKLIRVHRIIVPPPSRRALQAMCDEGKLKATKAPNGMWLVSEESFLKWVKELNGEW